MKNSSVKKLIIPTVYLVAVLSVIGAIYLTITGIDKYFKEKEKFDYSINGLTNSPVKAVQGEETNTVSSIIRPYKSDKVSIGRYFYDFEGDTTEQENAIIFYENTYMQNTGVDYIAEDTFDVISVLPGTIKSVETDEILGNIIKIEHEKDVLTVYEGIDNISIKEGDKVNQGQVIGTSGTSSINSNYATSLHFEVYYKGSIIDPENFYSLNINEL